MLYVACVQSTIAGNVFLIADQYVEKGSRLENGKKSSMLGVSIYCLRLLVWIIGLLDS